MDYLEVVHVLIRSANSSGKALYRTWRTAWGDDPPVGLYLSPMIDCFDGLVISWTIGTRPDSNLVNTMLDAAIETAASGGDHLSFTPIVAPTIAGPGGSHECKTQS